MKQGFGIGALLALVVCTLLFSAPSAHATTNNTAEDTFMRANLANSWGTTTNNDGLTNYAWQRSLGSSPYTSIQNDMGVLIYTGTNGHKDAGYINVPANSGGDILEKFALTHIGEAEAGACLDVAGGTSWYQADINTDLGALEIRKRLNGIMTTEVSLAMSTVAGQAYWLREDVQVSGGVATIQARLWADGTSEPTSWQVSWSDSSPLAAGQAGAMGDWFKAPPSGTEIQFANWAYATSGLASPAA